MAIQLKYMEGKEFVRQALSGKIDFSQIILEEGFNLSGYEGFDELQKYLKKQNFIENPFVINHSQLKGVKAIGIYLPYVKGHVTDLEGAYLEKANLREAKLEGADLREAKLEGADLRGAYLREAKLEGADLKAVKNLKNVLNLEEAIFCETRVSEKEKAIIENALKKRPRFIVE